MSKFILLGLDGACPDIINEMVEKGIAPNFKRLREMGCSGDNIPFPSAVTPGNWTSITTGSKPATIGISDFMMHTPGKPLDEKYSVFSKTMNNRAEFIWDAYADRGYKVATIAHPGSLPQTKENHLAIGNDGSPAENTVPYTIAPSRALVAGSLNPVGPYDWHEHERIVLEPIGNGPDIEGFKSSFTCKFLIKDLNSGFSGQHEIRFFLGTKNGKTTGVIVDGEKNILIGKREWTPYIQRPFFRDNTNKQEYQLSSLEGDEITGEFRLRIIEVNLKKGDLLLYVSTVYPETYFSSNQKMTDKLRKELGPYNGNLPISRLVMGWYDDQAFYDEFRVQGIWEAKAAVKLINDFGFKAVLTKWHAFDKFYHFFMQKIDSASACFNPNEFDRYEKLHQMIIRIADEMVGIVLDGLQEDTSLIVISDHGLMASRKDVWVNRYLAQNGYISYSEDNQGKVVINWKKTKAFVSAFMLLNVNLKGRDPDGIIEPGEEFEKMKMKLIELLRGWMDPETGRHVMTDVFDAQKDGAFYGMGSDLDGDIRYFAAPGYTLFRSIAVNGEEVITDARGPYLGDHGSCRPTTHFSRGSEVGIFYAVGKGFRHLKEKIQVFPIDIMTTLMHIAGEPPLKHQEGVVLHKYLKG